MGNTVGSLLGRTLPKKGGPATADKGPAAAPLRGDTFTLAPPPLQPALRSPRPRLPPSGLPLTPHPKKPGPVSASRGCRLAFPVFFGIASALALSSCAGLSAPRSPPEEAAAPAEAADTTPPAPPVFNIRRPVLAPSWEYIPHPPGALPRTVPPGVGILTGESESAALGEAERRDLREAFREAYLEGLLRGLPLAGVLGGDLVHGWPGEEPLSWVQNWRMSRDHPNSWGIPSLALALTGLGRERVFLVQGVMLDYYGKTGGRGGANGVAGYGAPLGNEFYYRGGRAQLFEGGCLVIDRDGAGRFLPREDSEAEIPAPVGSSQVPGLPPGVRAAFRSAWAALPRIPGAANQALPVPEGPATGPEGGPSLPVFPDGPAPLVPDEGVFRVSLAPNPPEGPFLGAENLYIQSFNRGRAFLVLADSPVVPFRPRLLSGPVLDALILAPAARLPGAADLSPGVIAGARLYRGEESPLDIGEPGRAARYPLTTWAALIRSLLEGLSLYGLPLGDPQPLERAGTPDAPGNESPGYPAVTEAQCFSRGWIANRE